MSEALISDVVRALELAVIERLPNATFHPLTPYPEWLSGAFAGGSRAPHGTLGEALPFLADFLPQAEGVWRQGHHASVESGPFAARIDGEDVLLRANALTVGGRALLVVERLIGIADSRPVLQRAREQLLEREQMVKHIETMRPAAAAIADAAASLSRSTLTDAQRRDVASVEQAMARIAGALEALPLPPQRSSRSRKI